MIRHLYANGLSISEISRRTGHDRKTVRKYIQAEGKLPPSTRKPRGSILDPFKRHIQERLERHSLSAVRILEEIREMGYPGSYTIVKDFVRQTKRATRVPAEYRYETGPGIQAQVDWGEVGYIDVDGKPRKLSCFAMVLGYSRTRYAEYERLPILWRDNQGESV